MAYHVQCDTCGVDRSEGIVPDEQTAEEWSVVHRGAYYSDEFVPEHEVDYYEIVEDEPDPEPDPDTE